MNQITVVCARPDAQDEAIGQPISPVLARVGQFTERVHFAGRFPNKDIDEHLSGRVVVVGEEQHLAAVALRLLRKDLLGSVELGYVALTKNEFTTTWRLPVGAAAVDVACTEIARPVTFTRDDVGGVLVSVGQISPIDATVYLDEKRLLAGRAAHLEVRPHSEFGLAVTVHQTRKIAGISLGRKSTTTLGRAVSIGANEGAELTVVNDGLERPRPLPRWTYYKHTEPLLLVHGR